MHYEIYLGSVQSWFNIWKSINVIYNINIIKIKNHTIIFLGTETVFESKTQSESKLSVM